MPLSGKIVSIVANSKDSNRIIQDIRDIETLKKELWKMAFEIKKEKGAKGLREFSKELSEKFGLNRTYHTLRQYAYVYEMAVTYEIPELPYTVIRSILGSIKSQVYIKQIKAGASYRKILAEIKQNEPKKHSFKCSRCGKVVRCLCQDN